MNLLTIWILKAQSHTLDKSAYKRYSAYCLQLFGEI